jgi:hypothetical protein
LILSSVGRISWPVAGPPAMASSTTQLASPNLIDKIMPLAVSVPLMNLPGRAWPVRD